MKKHIQSFVLAAVAALAPVVVIAHSEGHEKDPKKPAPAETVTSQGHGHEHTTKVPTSVPEILKAMDQSQVSLEKMVADRKLSSAHDPAFTIRDLAKSLVAKVPADKQAKVEQASASITKIASDIDKASAAGAQKSTETGVKAMAAALAALKETLG